MVYISDHPLIKHRISVMRDENTSTAAFRTAAEDVAALLTYEAMRSAEMRSVHIKTPVTEADVPVLADESPAVIPILRAGIGMLNGVVRLLPDACVGYIGLARDEQTHMPSEYMVKLPEMHSRTVIVPDPMLATGGSAKYAIDLIKQHGAEKIIFICIIAAPEGIDALQSAHPDIDIYAGTLDERLNENAFIVPGLGDAGDRLHGI